MQTPRIETIARKQLVGHQISMSLIDNKTFELFSGFMPKRNDIANTVSSDIYEVLVYNDAYFKNFNPNTVFTKWATVEVSTMDALPKGMESFVLEGGLYAVFTYKGLAQHFGAFMRYILSEWLPQSPYQLDHRPHFNVLGKGYKKKHPDSEEEVYIPITSS